MIRRQTFDRVECSIPVIMPFVFFNVSLFLGASVLWAEQKIEPLSSEPLPKWMHYRQETLYSEHSTFTPQRLTRGNGVTIRNTPRVKKLHVVFSFIESGAFKEIALAPDIEVAEFHFTNTDDDSVEALENSQSIKYLDLTATNVSDDCFDSIAKMPSLISIGIGRTMFISSESIQRFKESHPNVKVDYSPPTRELETAPYSQRVLSEWEIVDGEMIAKRHGNGPERFTLEMAKSLKENPDVSHLYIPYVFVEKEVWSELSKNSNLKSITLAFSNVDDKSVAELVKSETLESLDLTSTNVSTQCLESISSMKSIKAVYLYDTPFIHQLRYYKFIREHPKLQVEWSRSAIPDDFQGLRNKQERGDTE